MSAILFTVFDKWVDSMILSMSADDRSHYDGESVKRREQADIFGRRDTQHFTSLRKQSLDRFSEMSDNEVFEGRCYTEVKNEKGRIVWKINDFSKRTEMLKSSVFPTSAPQNIGKWCLWLYPKRENEFNASQGSSATDRLPEPYISIVIYQLSDIEIWATVKISLINDKGNVEKSVVTQCHKFTHKTYSGFPRLLERAFVLNKANGVLPNDELTIVCEIEIRSSSENRYQEFVPVKFERPLCRLAKDMGSLLSSESLTDLTITVGERQFRAHKAILAARSPVFAAMFRNEMVEQKFSVVDISDIDPDVFQEMLEFIYTGNDISQTNRIAELLAAANKYELERLKFMCEEVLCKVLSVDNILENIALADHYNAPYLKEYSLRFVMKNSSNIFGSSAWDDFKRSHQSLVLEIFEKICILK